MLKKPEEFNRLIQPNFEQPSAIWRGAYDGVRGEPPSWVPERERRRLHRVREMAVAELGYTPDALQLAAMCYPLLVAGTDDCYPNGTPITDLGYRETIGFLASLLFCVGLGEERGLPELVGDDLSSDRIEEKKSEERVLV